MQNPDNYRYEMELEDYHFQLGNIWSGGGGGGGGSSIGFGAGGIMDITDMPIKNEPLSPPMGQCAVQPTLEHYVSRDYFSDLNFNDDYGSDQADSPESNISPTFSEHSKTMQDFDGSQLLPGMPSHGLTDRQTEQDCGVVDGVKRVCLVCSDVASGYHYGVSSCEACKAFFKRTIQGSIEYSCPASNECEITKRRRKACQACRFNKCIRVGMLREGVRLDRVRGGRQKYKRNENGTTLIQPLVSCIPKKPCNETGTLVDNRYLSTLLAVEGQLDKVYKSKDLLSTSDDHVNFRAAISDVADKELVITISWAKQLPGFSSMNLNIQMSILQTSWLEVICLNTVFRSCPYSGQICFAEDLQVPEEMAEACGVPPALDQQVRRVCRAFTEQEVTYEEYVLLKAIVLTNIHTLNPQEPNSVVAVRNMQDKLQDSLSDFIRVRHAGASPRRLGQLFLLLPAITHIAVLYKRFWEDVIEDSRFPVRNLFREMLESRS